MLYNPEHFKEKHNINVQLGIDIVQIKDREQKIIFKWTQQSLKVFEESYDYLIMCKELKSNYDLLSVAMYSKKGLHNTYIVESEEKIKILSDFFTKNNIKDIVVVPGNLLGLKVVKKLKSTNKNITLVQIGYQILDALDYDMVEMVNKDLIDHNVELILKDAISEFYEDKVKLLISDKEIKAQAIVYTNMSLANLDSLTDRKDNLFSCYCKNNNKAKKLAIYNDKQIIVDKNYKTNLKNVYAIGNCIKLPNCMINTEKTELQVNTIKKQINNLLNHIFKKQIKSNKIITQTTHFKLFDFNICYTGLQKVGYNFNHKTAHVISTNNSDDILKQQPIHFKLIFEDKTKKILGAQVISKVNIKSKVDVITKMINNNATLYDLKKYCKKNKLENDVLEIVTKVALDVPSIFFKQIEHIWVRNLVENNEFILDVRSKEDYNKAHIVNAINIPFNELKQRYNEIPRDKLVYVHSRTGKTSYKVIKLLEKLGFCNLINI
ncbi:FAD-dependent oxidoreductase [Mycoplasma capricolum]|uniref:FAD-dependent oxidoreductase n=1 Tax=Mycoplasma capricolum TaxID=2095 RepID=UPI0022F38632|nr:FAD-dependent oxidoreductase [Mycoplasma capricolum]WBX36183.1 FAD-dependent oxidoreductase [Mycoplasma capricolum subsp. capricolum]